jgi:hypothetical protein
MTVTVYHGSADELTLHLGLCLTGDQVAADYARYASSSEGRIHGIELDLDSLIVVELDEGHDWDSNTAPGDNGEDYRDQAGNIADVIVFTDATAFGREHVTYRLMTDKALAAAAVTGCQMLEDC